MNTVEFRRLEKRVAEIEKRINKTIRKSTTDLPEQLLFLHHLGFIQVLEDMKLNRAKKAELLSKILNGSIDNIKSYLTEVHKKKSKIKTDDNYTSLLRTFEAVGLRKQANEVKKYLEFLEKNNSESQ